MYFMRRPLCKRNFEKKFASPALSHFYLQLIYRANLPFTLKSKYVPEPILKQKWYFSQFGMIFNFIRGTKKNFGFGLPIKKSKKNLKSRILKKKSLTLFSNMVYRLPVNKTGPYTPLFFCPPQPKQPHLCTFFEGRKKS